MALPLSDDLSPRVVTFVELSEVVMRFFFFPSTGGESLFTTIPWLMAGYGVGALSYMMTAFIWCRAGHIRNTRTGSSQKERHMLTKPRNQQHCTFFHMLFIPIYSYYLFLLPSSPSKHFGHQNDYSVSEGQKRNKRSGTRAYPCSGCQESVCIFFLQDLGVFMTRNTHTHRRRER